MSTEATRLTRDLTVPGSGQVPRGQGSLTRLTRVGGSRGRDTPHQTRSRPRHTDTRQLSRKESASVAERTCLPSLTGGGCKYQRTTRPDALDARVRVAFARVLSWQRPSAARDGTRQTPPVAPHRLANGCRVARIARESRLFALARKASFSAFVRRVCGSSLRPPYAVHVQRVAVDEHHDHEYANEEPILAIDANDSGARGPFGEPSDRDGDGLRIRERETHPIFGGRVGPHDLKGPDHPTSRRRRSSSIASIRSCGTVRAAGSGLRVAFASNWRSASVSGSPRAFLRKAATSGESGATWAGWAALMGRSLQRALASVTRRPKGGG